MTWWTRWSSWEGWELDLRSLALCRMATGLVMLADLVTRFAFFRLHYTDDGVLPRQLLYDNDALTFPSIYALSGWEPYLVLLFVFHALVSVGLMLGWRTRMCGFLAWYMTVSLQERMFMVNNGGDKVLSSLLFWTMFLPWGEALSVDAGGSGRGKGNVGGVVCAILLMQPVMMYWISVFHKMEPIWLRGEVLSYALQSDFYAYPVARTLLPYPGLLKVMTYLTLFWEILGPVVLLWPNRWARSLACVAFMVMHLGFGYFLRIGVFALTPSLYMLAFLPSFLWDSRFGEKLQSWLESSLQGLKLSSHPSRCAPRVGVQAALLALFVFVNANALGQDERLGRLTPPGLDWIVSLTGLNQRWSVFIDTPHIFDGWVVVEAKLADGREVDLFQGYEPARWGKPSTPYHRHDSFRWPTPLVVITGNKPYQKPFVHALMLDWEREHPQDRVTWASLMLFAEHPHLDYRKTTTERTVLWEGNPR